FKLDQVWVYLFGISLVNYVHTKIAGYQYRHALILRVKGRKSGNWHQTVLPYSKIGEEYMVTASLGGAPRDPQWAKNLRVHPNAELIARGNRMSVSAGFAEDDEYNRLWEFISDRVPTYKEYQKRCEGVRQIPLILLKPDG